MYAAPPTNAAAQPSATPRRKTNVKIPASTVKMKKPNAIPTSTGKIRRSSAVGKKVSPCAVFARNGIPPNRCGYQPGTSPFWRKYSAAKARKEYPVAWSFDRSTFPARSGANATKPTTK
jgi:hypothetical protein